MSGPGLAAHTAVMLVMIDLDNTLVDRAGAVAAWVGEFCSAWSLPADAADWILDLDNDGYADRRTVFQTIGERFGLEPSTEQLLIDYRRRVIELTGLAPGATECLHDMRSRGWQIVIVSNGSTGQQHGKVDSLGLRSMVDAVCVSQDLGVHKPDALIFEAAASMAGVDLDGAWMVGDSPRHDIIGAAGLGLDTAWVRRDRVWDEAAQPPTVTVDSLLQLVESIDHTLDRRSRDC